MGMNILHHPLPTFAYQTSTDSEEILRAVHTLDFVCELSGELTVAGGTTDGTLLSEAEFRLIDSARLIWDGVDLIQPLSGRELAELSRRLFLQQFSNTTVSIPGVQTSTAFSVFFVIPVRRRYLANPIEVHIPPLPVTQSFRLEIEWNDSKTTSGSDAGSGAFVSGGDRTVTLANVELKVVQVYAHNAPTPEFVPVISRYDSEQFSAANQRLELQLKSSRPMDAMLVSTREGGDLDYADLIQNVTLQSGSTRWFDNVPYTILHEWEQIQYPAVGDSPVGNLWLPFADGGKLGNAMNPSRLNNPRFEFNVSAPGTNPGYIRVIQMELLKIAGSTTVPAAQAGGAGAGMGGGRGR